MLKPDRAQFILIVGFPINPNAAIKATPAKPISAAGIGSRISPTTTAKNIAKKCHAFCDKPSGAGINHITTATRTGISSFIFRDDIKTPYKKIK